MNKSSNAFINYLVIGYAFVIILVALSAGIFFNYEQKISSSFKTYTINNQLKGRVNTLFNAATQRSILMIRMINTEDTFVVDELQMKMHFHERQVNVNLIELETSATSLKQKELLALARSTMGQNREKQDKVYNLIIDDQREQALEQLVDVTLPTQRNVFEILSRLKVDYDRAAKASQIDFAHLIDDMRNMILFVAMPIILSLLIIALLSIRNLKRFSRAQQELLENLETIVHNRTQELLLDRQLMHNLNEAIGIFDQSDQVQISNKQLNELLVETQVSNTLPIWSMLDRMFENLDVETIQNQLDRYHSWRGEAALNSANENFMIIDIGRIDDKSLPENFFSIILTDITDLKEAQDKLEFTANYDVVTQLPNRYFFNRKIQELIQETPNESFHLLYLDLDDFKWVNDHLGHAAGDNFLYQVGQVFLEGLPENHFLARLGGDEFVIIIQQQTEDHQLGLFASKLLVKLKQLNQALHADHEVGCSVGIASYPNHGHTLEALLKSADYAMYQSKKRGRNQFCLFSHQLNEELKYRQELEQNLRSAVKSKSFEVHYQPQYSLNTLKLVGAEALVRWHHQDKTVPPDIFIPLAERFGLINEIGEFVFETAAKQLKDWSAFKKGLPRIAINTSSTQLLAGNFGGFVEEVIKKHDLLATQIDIEITESVMMKNIQSNSEENANCLTLLQSKGLEISIDDFGTGYSSLSYIKHLNVDRIKIDKSFIDDIEFKREARSIVEAIIKMGHSLGLKVLAEGIETPNQLDILKQLDCDEGQGYLFSKPIPADKFEMKCLKP